MYKELNHYPLLDNSMARLFMTLRPFYSIPDLAKPCSVSGNLSLDTPNNTILANYLADDGSTDGDDTMYDKL